MNARTLRNIFREPYWFVLLVAAVVGALAGSELAHETTSDAAEAALGTPWRGDPSDTRGALAAILGFLATIVALVLSVNAMVIKGAAYQYSPRLIPLYLKNAPIKRAVPMFVLLAAYSLAAFRELGLVADDAERPRVVVSGAVGLLFLALLLMAIDVVRTVRFVRVERVLGLVRDATFAAAKRVTARAERLKLDRTATLELPLDASALVAADTGYLVDVDVRRLVRLARDGRVRARVCRAMGEYVCQDEVIGWAAADDGKPVDGTLARALAGTLEIGPVRELDYDPALGVRIIVDVANRALGSSANDPYTARQALNQLRSVLRHVGRLPLNDWNVVDEGGGVRVSITGMHLRELLSVAVGGPLHFGGSYPEVLEGLLEIVLEVGWIARDPADRAAARTLLERIDDLAARSEIDPERLERYRAEAAPVRQSLGGNGTGAPRD